MRRIIDRLIYDTATATELGSATGGSPYHDLDYWEESLYRTPRGRYFTAGHGGARTHYGWDDGRQGGGGSGITPMTTEEAIEWAEDHGVDSVVELLAEVDDA
ncbi:MAG: hypothetical protein H6733_07835 [Alphaproteobacteria bacterium]|nr:hypothetical protein [Alphaproteobacteria bacterium]